MNGKLYPNLRTNGHNWHKKFNQKVEEIEGS